MESYTVFQLNMLLSSNLRGRTRHRSSQLCNAPPLSTCGKVCSKRLTVRPPSLLLNTLSVNC
jgi:hypothetical protein